jgi:D-3-phosphoglycerate dehydrogenase
LDVQVLSLDQLAASADVLVICCPLTEATKGAISAAQIGLMKPGAVLINVARRPILDTPALTKALQSRCIAGAALDVFDSQPLPETSQLWALDNVILTPHMAGITQDSMLRMGNGAADEALRILNGALQVNFCNPQVEPACRARFPA